MFPNPPVGAEVQTRAWSRRGGGGSGWWVGRSRACPIVITVAAASVVGLVGLVGLVDVVLLLFFAFFALVVIFRQGRRGWGRGGGPEAHTPILAGRRRWGGRGDGRGAPASSTSAIAKTTAESAARGTLVYGAAVAATLLAAAIIHAASAFCFFVARFLARAVHTREGGAVSRKRRSGSRTGGVVPSPGGASRTFLAKFVAKVHAFRRPEEDANVAGLEPRALAALATIAPKAEVASEGRIKPWPRRPSVLPLGCLPDKAPMSRPARVRVRKRLDDGQGLSSWLGGVAERADPRFRAIWASHRARRSRECFHSGNAPSPDPPGGVFFAPAQRGGAGGGHMCMLLPQLGSCSCWRNTLRV